MISLESFYEAFEPHESWSDLSNPISDFVQFLNDSCGIKGQPNYFSSIKLRILGILWCSGSSDEKILEFYDCFQNNDSGKIACNHRDFKPYLFLFFYMATEMVLLLKDRYKKYDNLTMCKIEI